MASNLVLKGTIVANDQTGTTSKESLCSGGDVVSGATKVISTMGAGRKQPTYNLSGAYKM